MYHVVRLKREIEKEIKSKKTTRTVLKKVFESYVVNSESVTESEAKLVKWLPSDYQNTSIEGSVLSPIKELVRHDIDTDDENWFLLRVGFMNGDTGNFKAEYILANGLDLKDSLDRTKKFFSEGTTIECKYESIATTKLIIEEELTDLDIL